MSEKKLSSWGNHPKIKCDLFQPKNLVELSAYIKENTNITARGNGRSYGDSALGNKVVDFTSHDYFLNFDEAKGELHIESGVLLSDILKVIIPKGWFLKVVPGTKFITIGGAIASDIHGKNHHIEGCFSQSVIELNIMNPEGQIENCSQKNNTELFHATCGGQGLTGIILNARIKLKRISSSIIDQTTVKTKNLKQTFEAFETHKQSSYSVAWIDCFAKDESIGRCLLTYGDFEQSDDSTSLNCSFKQKLNIPFNFPSFVLNKWTVKLFNYFYYSKIKNTVSSQKVSVDSFFFPLDSIKNWNRIYGSKGFVQYQFILPKANSYQGLKKILKLISTSGQGSFLAILKLYGPENKNYLSFPIEGYSLALDFKANKKSFELLDTLDEIVSEYKGRLYLTKDARMSKSMFVKGYPHLNKFKSFRKKNNMDSTFQSSQSKRLGL